MIETDKITTVIDPAASFTLEYLDMIMTIRANKWKRALRAHRAPRVPHHRVLVARHPVLHVQAERGHRPRHARLPLGEVAGGVPEHGVLDLHQVHDHRAAHVHRPAGGAGRPGVARRPSTAASSAARAWKDQAALAFGFFQMAGYNRYDVGKGDAGRRSSTSSTSGSASTRGGGRARRCARRRRSARAGDHDDAPGGTPSTLDQILPYGPDKARSSATSTTSTCPSRRRSSRCARATTSRRRWSTRAASSSRSHDACVCWINMPTFKSNSLFIRAVAHLAALIKIPSRVTTFLEMLLVEPQRLEHVAPLRAFEGESFELPGSATPASRAARSPSRSPRPTSSSASGTPTTVPAVSAALKVDLRNGSARACGRWTRALVSSGSSNNIGVGQTRAHTRTDTQARRACRRMPASEGPGVAPLAGLPRARDAEVAAHEQARNRCCKFASRLSASASPAGRTTVASRPPRRRPRWRPPPPPTSSASTRSCARTAAPRFEVARLPPRRAALRRRGERGGALRARPRPRPRRAPRQRRVHVGVRALGGGARDAGAGADEDDGGGGRRRARLRRGAVAGQEPREARRARGARGGGAGASPTSARRTPRASTAARRRCWRRRRSTTAAATTARWRRCACTATWCCGCWPLRDGGGRAPARLRRGGGARRRRVRRRLRHRALRPHRRQRGPWRRRSRG